MSDLDKLKGTDEWEDTENIEDFLEEGLMGKFDAALSGEAFTLEEIMKEVRSSARTEKQTREEQEEKERAEEGPREDLSPFRIGVTAPGPQEDEPPVREAEESPAPVPPAAEERVEADEIAKTLKAMFDDDEEDEEPEEENKEGLFAALFHKKKAEPREKAPIEEEARPLPPAEELPAGEQMREETEEDDLPLLLERLQKQRRGAQARSFAAGAQWVLLGAMSLAPAFGVTLPFESQADMTIKLFLYIAAGSLCYRELWEGTKKLFSLSPAFLSISTLGYILALCHGLLQIPAVRAGEDFVFFGAAALTGVFGAALSRSFRLGMSVDQMERMVQSSDKEQLSIVSAPALTRLAEEAGDEFGLSPLCVGRRRVEKTFDTQKILEQKTEADRWEEKSVPVMLVAILVAAALVLLFTRRGGELLTVITLFTVVLIPPTAPFAAFAPMFWGGRRAKEALILHNDEAGEFARCDSLIFTDDDLFGKEGMVLKGMRVFGENGRIDELFVDVASLFYQQKIGLAKVFLSVFQNDLSALKEVTEANCFEGDGIRAVVGGEELIVGTGAFLQKCGLASPNLERTEAKNPKIKNLYVAKGGELACVFAVGYLVRGHARLELAALYQNHINVILDTRDMNLTKKNVAGLFDIAEDGVFTVNMGVGENLGEKRRGRGVYTLAGDLFAFADVIRACRHMKGMLWRNVVIHTVLAVISFLLFFALMALGGIDQITVEKILLYMAVCTLPFLVNSAV